MHQHLTDGTALIRPRRAEVEAEHAPRQVEGGQRRQVAVHGDALEVMAVAADLDALARLGHQQRHRVVPVQGQPVDLEADGGVLLRRLEGQVVVEPRELDREVIGAEAQHRLPPMRRIRPGPP